MWLLRKQGLGLGQVLLAAVLSGKAMMGTANFTSNKRRMNKLDMHSTFHRAPTQWGHRNMWVRIRWSPAGKCRGSDPEFWRAGLHGKAYPCLQCRTGWCQRFPGFYTYLTAVNKNDNYSKNLFNNAYYLQNSFMCVHSSKNPVTHRGSMASPLILLMRTLRTLRLSYQLRLSSAQVLHSNSTKHTCVQTLWLHPLHCNSLKTSMSWEHQHDYFLRNFKNTQYVSEVKLIPMLPNWIASFF